MRRSKHKWRHCDWVLCDWMLWDNRSVMHQANPNYAMRERRYLYRRMLKGGERRRERLGVHSAFTPANLTTFAHFFVGDEFCEIAGRTRNP